MLVQNGTEGGSQFQDRVLDWQRSDPKRVLIELSGDGDPFPTVHSLDVYTGLTYVVQRSRSSITDWSADRNGVVRFGSGFDGRKHSYIARDSGDAAWRTLAKWEIGESDFSVVGFGASASTLLVEANHNGRNAIFEMDLEEKSDRQLLFANTEVDVGGPIYWPSDNRIIGFEYETDRTHRKFFDADAEAIYGMIDRAKPDADNEIVDSSRDGKRLLVTSRADTRPMEYLILDLNEQQADTRGKLESRARRHAAVADDVGEDQGGRRHDTARISHAATEFDRQEAAHHHLPARRSACARQLGLRSHRAIHGEQGIRGGPGELPRVDWLRQGVVRGGTAQLGNGDGG